MPVDFRSPAHFAAFLATASAALEARKRNALEEAAKVIEAEAKARIGRYQQAAPPFAAWAPLAPSTVQDRVQKGFTPNDPLLRTGELRDSIGHVVSGDEAVVGSNLEVAVYQELGTKRIPPRSFLGSAAVVKGKQAADAAGRSLMVTLVGPGFVAGPLGSED